MFKLNIHENKSDKKGQSTVEYIILVAAVIAALLIFLPGAFTTAYNTTLQDGTDGMTDLSTRLGGSRGTPPAATP